MKKQPTSKLVGKIVHIKDGSYYEGHWGIVTRYDGNCYYVSGGSIGDTEPIFDRDEFVVRRDKPAKRS